MYPLREERFCCQKDYSKKFHFAAKAKAIRVIGLSKTFHSLLLPLMLHFKDFCYLEILLELQLCA